MIIAENIKGKYISYKDRPLVRQDNELIYGSLCEEYYTDMFIMKSHKDEKTGLEIVDMVNVSLLATKDDKLERQFQASSLSEALEVSASWLAAKNC